MEKPKLCADLQNIVEQLATFRTKYTHLKTHCAAQEEIIRLQKLESDKMNSRVERLATALDDYQKCHNVTLRNIESENQRLRKIADDYSREKDNACVLQARGDAEDRVCDLEENLAELRSRLEIESAKHREEIEALKKSHEKEILVCKKKWKANDAPEGRDCEISSYEGNQLDVQSVDAQSAVAPRPKKVTFAHPALDGDNTQCRKKKFPSAAFKWPPLDFVAKQEFVSAPQRSTPKTKKKKLYQADNEMIVDLAT